MPSTATATSAAEMESEPDHTKPSAAAAAGHRKHLAMLERLSKRTATPSSHDSPDASPVAAFLSRFAAAKLAAKSALSACRSSCPEYAQPSLSTTATAIDDLDRLVAEASHSLPPYELRSALTAVSDLRAAHRLAASDLPLDN
ncbi:hypothetical protein E2562_036902 [Oryza meyeriana var. granulata]|uniref:Tubulin-specific chaperone C N-terminal domain-containing protein n=1 Tax=Oryza meyeriana var. granulata TaxID=110450 RepID=A0A6G1ETG6_9ORYZ|nr:hypothetical protein E2562_036902 [Oryza meyeriana var. granulata]